MLTSPLSPCPGKRKALKGIKDTVYSVAIRLQHHQDAESGLPTPSKSWTVGLSQGGQAGGGVATAK